ncbi:acyltransferase [Enterobacter cloacae]|uniref:acyltransferase family protein n=1 Tax=Enterobacter cloacae TaxID=550 RepID=UPI0039672F22
MKTLNHSYLSRLDHLRFFAIILVIFFHFRGKNFERATSIMDFDKLVGSWINYGATGVSLFLVLSGFLFCVISKAGEKPIDYKAFVKNRILRIFPLLTFVFFVAIAVESNASSPMDIFRLMTLQLNTGLGADKWLNGNQIILPLWTIAVEFQFYLIFPFIATFMFRYGIKYILGLIVTLLAVKIMLVQLYGLGQYSNFYSSIVGRLDQFLIGIFFGWIYLKQKEKPLPRYTSFLTFIISIVAINYYMVVDKSPWFYSVFSLSFQALTWALVIYSYLSLNVTIPKVFDKALSFLGSLSFSMYLLHMPIGGSVLRMFSDYNLPHLYKVSFIIVPIVIIASTLTYSVIEKPFLGLRSRYTK